MEADLTDDWAKLIDAITNAINWPGDKRAKADLLNRSLAFDSLLRDRELVRTRDQQPALAVVR
jgi:hypothetical protein